MASRRTFRQSARLTYGASVTAALVIGIASVLTLRFVIRSKDRVAFEYAQDLIDVETLRTEAERVVATARGYLFTGDPKFFDRMSNAREAVSRSVSKIRAHSHASGSRILLERVERSERDYLDLLDRLIEERRSGRGVKQLAADFENVLDPRREMLRDSLRDLENDRRSLLQEARHESDEAARLATGLLVALAAGATGLGIFFAVTGLRVLNRLYEESEKTARAREEIVALVSHDLKSPLSVILLNAQLLSRSGAPDALHATDEPNSKIKASAAAIERTARRMNRMIGDLLDLARMDAGQFTPRLEAVSARRLIDETAAAMSLLAAEKSVQLTVELPHGDFVVLCEFERVIQILGNLVSNAIKFSPAGEVVRVSASVSGGEALFSVSDHGPGVAPAQRSRIFERFRQARLADARTGTGLGLAIAKGFVESHGGRIWVESEPGKGSVFRFTLQVAKGRVAISPRAVS